MSVRAMLSVMAETCFVRFPDSEKDKPDTPDVPNPVKEIVAHKLDDYRAQGYVQCAEDGSALAKVQPAGAAATAGSGPKLAGADADPEAARIQGQEAPAAPAGGSSTEGGKG